ncbi:hypothetical protein [Halospeciosus flavus]|uniref:L-alanine-DL-glutamate epimerase n=1 Tax=Halospeciosus flavus TaxID=3032283 RepID=A0ABD5Z907_9EURY|nr:hypothetical protein [Halospeciosus flavus]
MTFYDRVKELPLVVDSVDLVQHRMDTSSGFERVSTVVELHGDGVVGRGEDVTYDAEDHEALVETAPEFPHLKGEFTLQTFSERLDEVDLWPEPPERETSRHYRRWAFESAALDLALRLEGADLGDVLGREYDPVRFVVSTRLPEGEDGSPTAERVHEWRDVDPTLEFKLDPTPDWDDDLVAELAETGAVRILDLKGQYEGTDVDNPADPDLYERIVEGFPDAIVEDPRLTDETREILRGHEARVSWDYPITGVESVRDLPWEPEILNVKPSRFGTVESLFDFLDYCEGEGIDLYGGGQFELAVGRQHLHTLASLCYPDAPNDVAPSDYNRPEPTGDLPSSPLDPPASPEGLGWE